VPEGFNAGLKASAADLEPDLIRLLQSEFGDRLGLDGGELTWRDA
jgi:hypothetical protein